MTLNGYMGGLFAYITMYTQYFLIENHYIFDVVKFLLTNENNNLLHLEVIFLGASENLSD
jgi:hypothetical protein